MERTAEAKIGLEEARRHLEKFGKREGWRPDSIAAFRRQLAPFGRFLEEEGKDDLREVDRAAIQRYQAWLVEAVNPRTKGSYAVRTRYAFLCAVRQTYRALVAEDLVLSDVSDSIVFPKLPRRLPPVLSKKEVERVFERAEMDTVLGYRDRTMLELLYSTLIRASEITGLVLGDVQEEAHRLFIHGKGGKERVVPVGRVAWGYLVEWRDRLRHRLAPKDDSLFPGIEGRRLSRGRISSMAADYMRRAGLKKEGSSAHVLRYSGATHMIENGADIREVQELLGHTSINTTMAYCLATATALKKAHEKSHPRDRSSR